MGPFSTPVLLPKWVHFARRFPDRSSNVDEDQEDTVTLSVRQFPAWLAFDNVEWVLSGAPTADDIGTLEIEIIASKNGAIHLS
jgi:hypothetical protein